MPSSAINITANAASRCVRVFNQVAQQCAVPILFLIFIGPLYQWEPVWIEPVCPCYSELLPCSSQRLTADRLFGVLLRGNKGGSVRDDSGGVSKGVHKRGRSPDLRGMAEMSGRCGVCARGVGDVAPLLRRDEGAHGGEPQGRTDEA